MRGVAGKGRSADEQAGNTDVYVAEPFERVKNKFDQHRMKREIPTLASDRSVEHGRLLGLGLGLG